MNIYETSNFKSIKNKISPAINWLLVCCVWVRNVESYEQVRDGNQMTYNTLTAQMTTVFKICHTNSSSDYALHMKNQCRILILMTTHQVCKKCVCIREANPKTRHFNRSDFGAAWALECIRTRRNGAAETEQLTCSPFFFVFSKMQIKLLFHDPFHKK